MDIGACKKRLFELACERGTPLPCFNERYISHFYNVISTDLLAAGRGAPPFKAFPLGGRWIAEALAKARRMRGRGMTERNVKDNPSSVATRQLPPKGKP